MLSFVKKILVKIFAGKKKIVTGKKIRHFLPTFFLPIRCIHVRRIKQPQSISLKFFMLFLNLQTDLLDFM